MANTAAGAGSPRAALAGPSGPDAPSPAVAPPPGQPRFALFDSLRGIAVLCVIAYHVAGLTGAIDKPVVGDVLALLSNGVTFFFVISGFLLYRPYAAAHAGGRPHPSVARYGRRRALRILPAYWSALTVLALFPGIVGVFSGDWWRYYLFLQIYAGRTLGGGIPQAWSLGVEVAFYGCLPLWAELTGRMIRRWPQRWLRLELLSIAALASVGIVIQVAASRLVLSHLLGTTLLGECTWLGLGMALAVLSVAAERQVGPSAPARVVAHHPGLCWLGAAACLAGAAALLRPGGLLNIIVSLRTVQPLGRTLGGILLIAGLSTLLAAPAVFGESAGGWPRRVLRWEPLKWLGVISYGVYLYHLTVAQLLWERSDPAHFSAGGLGLGARIHHLTTPILFALTVGGSVLLAAVSYRFVELPFLRRKES